MDQTDIRIFQAIIEHQNIQKASEALYMSPTTAGTRLMHLEEELGVTLFERAKGIKNVTLTEKGKQFIPLADQMLASIYACEALKDRDERIPLTIATADGFLNDVFYSFYLKVMEEYPYDLDIQRYPSDMIYRMVADQKADIGFALYELRQKDVIARLLYQEDIVVIVPEGDLLNRSVHPKDLDPLKEYLVADEENIFVGGGPDLSIWHQKWFDIHTRPKLRINNVSMAKPFLDASDYWMLVSRTMAECFQRRYPVKILELLEPAPESKCYIVENRLISESRKKQLDDFARLLKQQLSECDELEIR